MAATLLNTNHRAQAIAMAGHKPTQTKERSKDNRHTGMSQRGKTSDASTGHKNPLLLRKTRDTKVEKTALNSQKNHPAANKPHCATARARSTHRHEKESV